MNKLQMYQKFVRQLETRFSNQRLVSRIHFHNITINLQKKVSRSFYLNFTFMSPNLSYAFDQLKEIAWLELALRSVSLLFSIDELDATQIYLYIWSVVYIEITSSRVELICTMSPFIYLQQYFENLIKNTCNYDFHLLMQKHIVFDILTFIHSFKKLTKNKNLNINSMVSLLV